MLLNVSEVSLKAFKIEKSIQNSSEWINKIILKIP